MGAIYLSTSATDPATLFGGTWQRIQDRFLLCAGSTYSAGSEGGEATHTLTIQEMPAHNHTFTPVDSDGAAVIHAISDGYGNRFASTAMPTDSAGGGQSHNNMPPYLAVYAWKRTA